MTGVPEEVREIMDEVNEAVAQLTFQQAETRRHEALEMAMKIHGYSGMTLSILRDAKVIEQFLIDGEIPAQE